MSIEHEDGLGGSIIILEHGTTTAPMRMRMRMPKGMGPPAPECHPAQTEDFKILRGTLDLGIIDGKRVRLNAGDTYHMPAGVYHLPANGGDGELEFEALLSPGLESADMFTALYTAMREHRGLGRFALVATVFVHYARVIHFRAPIRTVMKVTAAIARIFGTGVPNVQAPQLAEKRHPNSARV